MSYIGSTPTTQSFIAGTDYFNGDGSTVAFTLSRSVVSVNDIEAVINNVEQQPNTAYTVSGTTITFTSAPSAGTGNIYVRYLSTTTQSITPSQNTVSYSTLNSDNQSKLGISFKNRIINGAMVIDQRNAGASVTTSSSYVYPVDRFRVGFGVGGSITTQQSSTAPSSGGFTNSLYCTVTTTDNLATAGDFYGIVQPIEGYNIADLSWGTASAKTVTISFWVRSSVTGTYSVTISNSAGDRSYPATYTISSANTWEQKSVTIVGDTSGTWLTTNGTGMTVAWNLGGGSTYATGTANAWNAAGYLMTSSQTPWISTSGATFYLTGVQLEVGTQATTFDYRSIGTELALCQRYFERSYDYGIATGSVEENGLIQLWGASDGASNAVLSSVYKVTKRANPTITWYNYNGTSGQAIYQRSGVSASSTTITTYRIGTNALSGYVGIGASWTPCLATVQWTSSAEL